MRHLLIAALAVTLSVPAAASDIVTVRIDIADVDLTRADASERIAKQIEISAREACTMEVRSRYIFSRDQVDRACVAEVRQAAMAKANRVIATHVRADRTIAAK